MALQLSRLPRGCIFIRRPSACISCAVLDQAFVKPKAAKPGAGRTLENCSPDIPQDLSLMTPRAHESNSRMSCLRFGEGLIGPLHKVSQPKYTCEKRDIFSENLDPNPGTLNPKLQSPTLNLLTSASLNPTSRRPPPRRELTKKNVLHLVSSGLDTQTPKGRGSLGSGCLELRGLEV